MNFDCRQVPFSRFGSYFAIAELPARASRMEGLYLRTVHGDASPKEIARLEVIETGQTVPFHTEATPWQLALRSDVGCVEICFSDSKTLRFRCTGSGLRLVLDNPDLYVFAMEEQDGSVQVNSLFHNRRFYAMAQGGSLELDAPWSGEKCSRVQLDMLPGGEYFFTESDVRPRGSLFDTPFDICRDTVREEFTRWLEGCDPVPARYETAAVLARYINWSAVAAPEGHFRRNAMLMSKGGMSNVWSWDHCFNAMALENDPVLAWDQFMVIFDHQRERGDLPDAMNDTYRTYNFCKPPVHGWALRAMLRKGILGEEQQREAYPHLKAWTNWWLNYRDDDGDGFPHYEHGNDSGWDNSTVFRFSPGVESPDLCAFLILQMEVMAELADRLSQPAEAAAWRDRSQSLLEKLIRELWNGNRFFARLAISHRPIYSDSLLPYMPIVLGSRLPSDILSAMADDLEKNFLTPYGLATERTTSPFYISDGYWRGPIWAPSTMLVVSGLREAGKNSLADTIARRFCDMVAESGVAENYNALTGEALRDKAYTWTSSVFLMLAAELE